MLVCLLLAHGSEKRNERRGDLLHIYLMVKVGTLAATAGLLVYHKFGCELTLQVVCACHEPKMALVVTVD